MFKKLGTQITMIIAIIITVMVATILLFALLQFKSYNDSILVERANVGVKVLEKEFDNIQEELKKSYEIFEEDTSLVKYIADKDETNIAAIIDKETDKSRNFTIITDADNNVIYKSGNCPLKTFDIKKSVSGIVSADDALVLLHSGAIGNNYIAIGYLLNEDTWLDDVKNTNSCDVTVFNGNLRYQTTLGANVIGTPMGDNIKKDVIDNGTPYSGQAVINNSPYYVAYTPIYDYNNKIVGAYFAGSNATDANNEFTKITWIAILIGVIWAIGACTFLIIFSKKRITNPLKEAEKYAYEIKNGKLDKTDVDFKFSDDEIGRFVNVLKSAKQDMHAVVGDASNILTEMSQGNFTENPYVDYPGVFEQIKNSLLKIESDLGDTLNQMSESSDEVLSGSEQMAEGSQSLADGTTRQASAIEQISATITDVSSQIARTAQNAAEAGNLSSQTQESVNQQDTEIQNMVAAMDEISKTSQEIEKIIKTIEDISFQTNILALNAAVEAARAGDAGKGFAVVADEVRNLANKSAEASASTASLINASIEAVNKGSSIAMSTAESMKQVKDMATRTAALISEIAIASQEQNDSIRQITTGIEQISQVIQTNSATAEETAASCEELSGQSKLLKEQIARFRTN